jgi:hypothetical protein
MLCRAGGEVDLGESGECLGLDLFDAGDIFGDEVFGVVLACVDDGADGAGGQCRGECGEVADAAG